MPFVERASAVLKFSPLYQFLQWAVGRDAAHWHRYLGDYIQPKPGDKILDIGCGPGDVLEYLSRVDYTGLDISPEYIETAKKRFGTRGRFLCVDVGNAEVQREQGTFDIALATGVLHHLDDAQATALFVLARGALRPGGRLVTWDGCYVPEQSRMARWLLQRDRGRFVRPPEEYRRLAAPHFPRIEMDVRHDLLRIPCSVLIMRCFA